MYNMPNYSYYQSPQSNETSQTYFLERTQSAKITLEKALKICPPTGSSSNTLIDQTAANRGERNNEENDVSITTILVIQSLMIKMIEYF